MRWQVNKFSAAKYLFSLNLLPIDFKNSAGNTYFHAWIINQNLDLLKLCFIDPNLLSEPYESKSEIEGDIVEDVNPEVFSKRIFEITSNKQNTILNCWIEYGTDDIFKFLFNIFISYYGQSESKILQGKRILNTEDKNGHSVLIKAAVKNRIKMMEIILSNHRYMIKESDLDQISKFLEGDNTTKLGSSKMSKQINNIELKKFINLYVNKIWDYLKDNSASKLKTYI